MTEHEDKVISSQGHHGSAVEWLDDHFQAAQAEYLAAVQAAGFQLGWHVLDAGCGSGSFLPSLAELIGPTGRITALDLAPENVAAVRERVQQWGLSVPFEGRVGSSLELPFEDNTFDGVWCANVTLYMSDRELDQAIQEFRRVVKPGGLVAIKDVDLGVTRLGPAPVGFFWHFLEGAQAHSVQVRGALRAQTMKRRLERAGFADVRQQTMLMERWAPLRPVERQYLQGILAFFADYALQCALPAEDLAIRRGLRSSDTPESLLNQTDFYWCEGVVLATGQVHK